MVPRFLLAALIAIVAPSIGAAQPASDEATATAAVARAITTYERFTIFDDVTLHIDGRDLTLRGKVTMPFKRDEIEQRTTAAAPGYRVRNEIEVLPVSIHDDALRRRVARAIYGNPAFWRQAAMVNPPIHIIVERGRVTLTGVVASEVDRALARSLATGQGELSLTSRLQTDAEVQAAALARLKQVSSKQD